MGRTFPVGRWWGAAPAFGEMLVWPGIPAAVDRLGPRALLTALPVVLTVPLALVLLAAGRRGRGRPKPLGSAFP
ncbi:MAG TPA: hypothetical protein VGL40_03870 [Bacillota bacterium]